MAAADNNQDKERSVLASLRSMVPPRRLQFTEALRIAEWQASRLLALSDIDHEPVPGELVSSLPRIRIQYRDLPTSGLSFWDGKMWVVCLNRSEPTTRCRFTLFHELKHIIDHGRTGLLYAGSQRHSADEQAEQAADYFAGCALVPRQFLKRAWGRQVQRPMVLARLFDVSPRAISVRLDQVGLTDPIPRCFSPETAPVKPAPGRYYRQFTADQQLGAARIMSMKEAGYA
jgi:Zn-dependent peptidase ImmA (M78 family)